MSTRSLPPYSALNDFSSILTGGSTGVLLLLNGDIMGISGILSNTLINPLASIQDSQHHWRWVFIASFCVAVNIYVNYLTPSVALKDTRSESSDVPIPSIIAMVLGGFLVGLGTTIGNGCTTGHGICGIGRFSPRSLVATVTFTGCAIFSRFLVSPLRSWAVSTDFLRSPFLPTVSPLASALVMAVTCLIAMVRQMPSTNNELETLKNSRKSLGAALSGILFAFGLAISGMTNNSKVHDFLCFSGLSRRTFDPTLMAVMGSGILSSFLAYQFVQGYSLRTKGTLLTCPLALPDGCKFSVPTNLTIDWRLLTGTAIFGMGWGLTGICPGPALYAAAAGVVDAIVAWFPGFLVGSYAGQKVVEMTWEKKKTA
jgi:uncharacterized membrane protein YedE/YeeE